ncbi:MAG: protoheme IX farnesyltransferase, partial [Gramella sp.]|nr:protoheme IX farnesyltransferase [Christiangramia sp.]
IIISLVPVFGVTGKLFLTPVSGVIILILGLGMLYYAIRLYKEKTAEAAKKLMFASVSYITLLQIVYVIDKFIRQWI